MQVQDVLNIVSNDMRQVLSPTSDTNILIPWVDRIHKDVLHTSLFNSLLRKFTTITTLQDVSVYPLIDAGSNPLPIRRIVSVYDRAFDRTLMPYDNLAFPEPKSDQLGGGQETLPESMLSASTMLQWPAYFMREGQNLLHLFPAPQKNAFGGTYEVYYEAQVASLKNLTDTLLVPDDGMDVVVAGVNMLAAQYLKNPEDAQAWAAQYQAMKNGAFRG